LANPEIPLIDTHVQANIGSDQIRKNRFQKLLFTFSLRTLDGETFVEEQTIPLKKVLLREEAQAVEFDLKLVDARIEEGTLLESVSVYGLDVNEAPQNLTLLNYSSALVDKEFISRTPSILGIKRGSTPNLVEIKFSLERQDRSGNLILPEGNPNVIVEVASSSGETFPIFVPADSLLVEGNSGRIEIDLEKLPDSKLKGEIQFFIRTGPVGSPLSARSASQSGYLIVADLASPPETSKARRISRRRVLYGFDDITIQENMRKVLQSYSSSEKLFYFVTNEELATLSQIFNEEFQFESEMALSLRENPSFLSAVRRTFNQMNLFDSSIEVPDPFYLGLLSLFLPVLSGSPRVRVGDHNFAPPINLVNSSL